MLKVIPSANKEVRMSLQTSPIPEDPPCHSSVRGRRQQGQDAEVSLKENRAGASRYTHAHTICHISTE